LIAAFTPDWGQPVERLLPDKLDSAGAPSVSAWATLTPDARLADARQQVAAYRLANPGEISLRVALPDNSGGNVLWGQIGARLATIGIRPIRVAMNGDADVRLVDEVAPYDSARWYLATACVMCSDDAQAALTAARDARPRRSGPRTSPKPMPRWPPMSPSFRSRRRCAGRWSRCGCSNGRGTRARGTVESTAQRHQLDRTMANTTRIRVPISPRSSRWGAIRPPCASASRGWSICWKG